MTEEAIAEIEAPEQGDEAIPASEGRGEKPTKPATQEADDAGLLSGEDGEGQAEGEEIEEIEGGGDAAEIDLEEVEWEGESYKIPRALKPALMMHADYTRKTQELGEFRRSVEESRQAAELREQSLRSVMGDMAQLHAVSAQLHNLQSTDFQRLDNEDPMEANNRRKAIIDLDRKRAAITQKIQQQEQQRQQIAQREAAKRDEEYRQALAREFSDWTPDLDLQLTNYARNQGYSDQELASVRDTRAVRVIRKAMLYDQLQAKQRQQKPKAKAQGAPVTPLSKPAAAGRGQARPGLNDGLSAEEWVKRREKELAAKNRR